LRRSDAGSARTAFEKIREEKATNRVRIFIERMRPNACAAYEETLLSESLLFVSPRGAVNFRRNLFAGKWYGIPRKPPRFVVTSCDTLRHPFAPNRGSQPVCG